MAAPALALSDNSDCVLAESAEDGTVPLMEEAAMESEAGVTSPVLERWGGHQGPAEAGIVPLSLVAAPAPALSDSDCVLAESAEDGTVLLAEEAVIQSEASPVPEWGAGHCPPVPVVVAAPVPALSSDSDCVLTGSKFQCGECGVWLKTKKQLQNHKRQHMSQLCIHCGRFFSGSSSNLKEHMKRCSMKEESSLKFECQVCDKKTMNYKDISSKLIQCLPQKAIHVTVIIVFLSLKLKRF